MKKCIWCLKVEPDVKFEKRAHIFPQSLGAKKIFLHECDDCNKYFGNYNNNKPSIDLVLKEAFNLTRYMLLSGSNKIIPKFKSEYFNADHEKKKWGIKQQFKLRKDFQENLGLQLKKGLIKIAIETIYLEKGIGYEEEFDFLRDFVRHDSKQCKVYYLNRKYGAVLTSEKMLRNPELMLPQDWEVVFNEFSCFEFELLTHKFIVPLKKEIPKDFFSNERKRNEFLFHEPIDLTYFTDIDFSLNFFRN